MSPGPSGKSQNQVKFDRNLESQRMPYVLEGGNPGKVAR